MSNNRCNVTWIRFDTSISDATIAREVSTFVACTGYQRFKERISQLNQRMRGNPFAGYMLSERHSLEFAIWDAHRLVQTYHRLPGELTSHYHACSFVTVFNRLYSALPSSSQRQLVGKVHHAFDDENDLRSVAREFTIAVHLINLGCKIECHDLEEGRFDFLCLRDGCEFELECKSISVDKGRQIHQHDILRLSDHLEDEIFSLTNQRSGTGNILSVLIPSRLSNSPTTLAVLTADVVSAFRTNSTIVKDEWKISSVEFAIEGSPYAAGKRFDIELTRAFVKNLIPESTGQLLLYVRPGKSALILDVHSRKPDKYIDAIYRELKSAAAQFSGVRPSIIWAALTDLASNELESVARDAPGNGLAAIATRLLRNKSRAHLHSVIFSGESLLNRRADGSVGSEGKTYRFPNPNHDLAADHRLKI